MERDMETLNPRSHAFSHIETMIKDKGGLTASVAGSDGGNSSSSKRIDMDIIDRIKSMRSKSRESSSLVA